MQKYDEERDKRLRPEGVAQYIDLQTSDKHKHFIEDPWIDSLTPVNTPVTDGGRCKVLIVGGGFGGIVSAVRLIQAGVSADEVLIVEQGGGLGGTWYWYVELREVG